MKLLLYSTIDAVVGSSAMFLCVLILLSREQQTIYWWVLLILTIGVYSVTIYSLVKTIRFILKQDTSSYNFWLNEDDNVWDDM